MVKFSAFDFSFSSQCHRQCTLHLSRLCRHCCCFLLFFFFKCTSICNYRCCLFVNVLVHGGSALFSHLPSPSSSQWRKTYHRFGRAESSLNCQSISFSFASSTTSSTNHLIEGALFYCTSILNSMWHSLVPFLSWRVWITHKSHHRHHQSFQGLPH